MLRMPTECSYGLVGSVPVNYEIFNYVDALCRRRGTRKKGIWVDFDIRVATRLSHKTNPY